MNGPSAASTERGRAEPAPRIGPARVAAALIRALAPIALALIVGAVVLLALGRDPLEFYGNIIKRSVISPLGLQETIIRMTPLLLIGAGLIVAFRAGLWQLGIDGQLLLGAVFVGAAGPELITFIDPTLTLALLMLIGALAGALWAVVPALLRAYYGVNEIITTLMMTFLALSLAPLLVKTAFHDVTTDVPQTKALPFDDRLPGLFDSLVHVGFLVALAAILIVHFVMTRTAFGLRLQTVGANPRAAVHAGLNVPRLTVAVFCLSAGLAGLGGAIEIIGVEGIVRYDWNPAFGLVVVPLVFLARLHGVASIAFIALFAVLSIGGEFASRKAGLPNHFLLVVVALVLIFLAVTEYLTARRQKQAGVG